MEVPQERGRKGFVWVCHIHLGKLRVADVVRYDTSGKESRYWPKHKPEMKGGLLKMLERVVDASANSNNSHFDVSRILETWKFRQERGPRRSLKG